MHSQLGVYLESTWSNLESTWSQLGAKHSSTVCNAQCECAHCPMHIVQCTVNFECFSLQNGVTPSEVELCLHFCLFVAFVA